MAFLRLLESDDGAWNRQVIAQAMMGFTKAGDPLAAFAAWREGLARADLFSGAIYDPRFTALTEEAPIGGEWIRTGEQLVSTDPAPGGGLRLAALAGGSGQVVSQMVRLGAGPHELVTDMSGDERLLQALRWEVQCAGAGKLPVTQGLTRSADGWRGSVAFNVPPGCGVAYVALVVAAPVAIDSSATLRSVALNPAG